MQPGLDCRFANTENLCGLRDIKVLHVSKNEAGGRTRITPSRDGAREGWSGSFCRSSWGF